MRVVATSFHHPPSSGTPWAERCWYVEITGQDLSTYQRFFWERSWWFSFFLFFFCIKKFFFLTHIISITRKRKKEHPTDMVWMLAVVPSLSGHIHATLPPPASVSLSVKNGCNNTSLPYRLLWVKYVKKHLSHDCHSQSTFPYNVEKVHAAQGPLSSSFLILNVRCSKATMHVCGRVQEGRT